MRSYDDIYILERLSSYSDIWHAERNPIRRLVSSPEWTPEDHRIACLMDLIMTSHCVRSDLGTVDSLHCGF